MSSERQGPEDRWSTDAKDEQEAGQGASQHPQPAQPTQRTSAWPPTDQSPIGWDERSTEPQPESQQSSTWQPPPGWQQPATQQQPGGWPQQSGWQEPSARQEPMGWQPPANQWQAQQPGGAWAPGAQPPWPPTTQPGWGGGYWPAQGQPYGSSAVAVIGATVLLVIGALMLVIAAFGLLVSLGGGPEVFEPTDPRISPQAMAGFVVVFFGLGLIFALLHIVAAIGVYVHKPWARWLGIVISVIALLLGVLLLLVAASGPAAAVLFVVLWLAAYGFSLVGLAAGGRHFARQEAWR